MSGRRLPKGGRIDRTRPLSFRFDGELHSGFAGDSLASALIANGVGLMGRSFKYHRPRGLVTLGSAEPNALVELREGARLEPNSRAGMVELYEGLAARSQNRWPSLAFDLGGINQFFAPLLVAGFYYKTFMWPKAFWEKLYEPLIRRAAGLGRAAREADPDSYEKSFAHCDVLVIGAGACGIQAALTAARAGARVILADEQAEMGGGLLFGQEEIGGKPGAEWLARALAELASFPDVRLLSRTTVFGWFDGNVFGAAERVSDHLAAPEPFMPRQRYWRIFAKRAVLATGAEERPVVFGNNDLPGVMQAEAVHALAGRYGVAAGRSVALFTNNNSTYRAARELKAAGVEVTALIDSRDKPPKLDAGGVPVLKGAVIADAHGRKGLTSVSVRLADREMEIAADAVGMSGGFSPRVHLACHRGLKPIWNEAACAFLPPDTGAQLRAAGAANGTFTLGDGLAEAARVAALACQELGLKAKASAPKALSDAYAVKPLWHVQARHKAFVDFQNDVTARDVPLAAREGYAHVELAKRYTTLGMATDQGKLSNVNGIALLAQATGRKMAEVGTTTFRPNYTPVALGVLAGPFTGKHFAPTRKTPLHHWAAGQGAVFVEAGLWLRAQYFPKPGEDWLKACTREVLATRQGVGLCDVSTLGKIDIQGRDACEFLNRLYCNGWSTLEVGRARYGLMLREDGMVLDDGTTSRLGPEHYLMTTTTANAGTVMAHMEFCHQALWPELQVQFTSVTEQWGQIAIAGPKARDTLARIMDKQKLDDASFPFMAAAETSVMGGIRARLFRISFSGELAYELAVPADYTEMVARGLMHAGAPYAITPYGLEALNVMRVEKGHVTGSELIGTVTAADVGMGRMMSTKKDYVGRVLAQREALTAPDREVLVGIRPKDKTQVLHGGGHVVTLGDEPVLEADQGHITSTAFSPMLGHWIGLALVKRGRERMGETVQIYDGVRGRSYLAEICPPVHFDAENRRLHG